MTLHFFICFHEICILSISRHLYQDNVAQLCFLVSLLPCYVIPLLTLPTPPLLCGDDLFLHCVLTTAGLQFFYLSAFTFLLLESLVLLNKLVDSVNLPLLESSLFIVISGVAPPLLYTGVIITLLYEELVPMSNTG